MISFTLSTVTPLANGDTIGQSLFSYKKNCDWETSPSPLHTTWNREYIRNMCLSLVAESEDDKAMSSKSSYETCKIMVLQRCHLKKNQNLFSFKF